MDKLEELIITIGGALFSGASLAEVDTELLNELEELTKAEILFRNSGMDNTLVSEEVH
tara:strand:+ start:115 stop:288 length:174 start_codon:yes stop_codon:yes gene_type:complete